jgi:hypothetical protein
MACDRSRISICTPVSPLLQYRDHYYIQLWVHTQSVVRCILCDSGNQWRVTGRGFLYVLRFPHSSNKETTTIYSCEFTPSSLWGVFYVIQVTNGVWQVGDFYMYSGFPTPPIKGPLLYTVVSSHPVRWEVYFTWFRTDWVWTHNCT